MNWGALEFALGWISKNGGQMVGDGLRAATAKWFGFSAEWGTSVCVCMNEWRRALLNPVREEGGGTMSSFLEIYISSFILCVAWTEPACIWNSQIYPIISRQNHSLSITSAKKSVQVISSSFIVTWTLICAFYLPGDWEQSHPAWNDVLVKMIIFNTLYCPLRPFLKVLQQIASQWRLLVPSCAWLSRARSVACWQSEGAWLICGTESLFPVYLSTRWNDLTGCSELIRIVISLPF